MHGKRRPGRLVIVTCSLLFTSLAVRAQFAGPSGFGGMGGYGSRDPGSLPGRLSGIGFTPYVSAHGTYSSSIPYLDGSKISTTQDSYGGIVGAGFGGGHSWGRTTLGGFASASYSRLESTARTEGISAVGSLGLSHQFSERFSLAVAQMLGSSFGGYGYSSAYSAYGMPGLVGAASIRDLGLVGDGAFNDSTVNGVVDNEVFANRVTYTGSFVSMRYQTSRRWQIGGSGSAYFVKRKDTALNDMQAYSGSGIVSYLLGPRSSLTLGYTYGQFAYPSYFGGIRTNQAYLGWGFKPNDRSVLNIYGGAVRLNSKYLGTVPLDPDLAEMLGVPSMVEVQAVSRIGAVGGFSYNYRFRKLGFMAMYNRSMMPGNGVLFASMYDYASTGLSYSLTDRLSVGGSAVFTYAVDQIVVGSKSQMTSLGGSAGFRLGKGFHITGGGGYSRALLPAARNRAKYASLGITWSPSSEPIRF